MQSTSENTTEPQVEEDPQFFAVSPKMDCPHEKDLDLDKVIEAFNEETLKAPCKDCGDSKENWMCLECLGIFCSRYVKSHMASHNQTSGHKIAVSFSDISFWCYSCDSYIYSTDLRIIASTIGKIKFGGGFGTKSSESKTSGLSKKGDDAVNFTKEDLIKGLKEKKFKNVCFMTGAGISVAAGIPDFRTPGTGLYSKLEKFKLPFPEAIFSIDYLKEKPEAFYALSKGFLDFKSSPVHAHYFIKKFHDENILLLSYTQNIDGLEHEAGVPLDKMVEAHGHMRSIHCIECEKEHPVEEYFKHVNEEKVFYCDCEAKGIVKPDIIFFGEKLPQNFFLKFQEINKADLVFVMGTSLKVFPFASLLQGVNKKTPIVLINRENPGIKRDNFLFLEGSIEDSVLSIMKELNWEIKDLKKEEQKA